MVTLFLFLMGLVWGSFLNVVIFRVSFGQSPLSGRSKCPNCGKKIDWIDNIPLLSFLLLRGKCKKCHKKISFQYPLVELMTGLLFVWWYMAGSSFFVLVGSPWQILQPVFWLVVGMLLLIIFVTDLRFGIIPDVINLLFVSLALFYRVSLISFGKMQSIDLFYGLISAFVLTFFFWFLWWVTKRKGFGFGDVKLAPALGLLLGFPRILICIFVAFVLGSIVGLVLMFLGKKKFGQTIPFGPFLVIGVVIALLWGADIWNWYMSLL
jgi:prepilin signal peptidase PulO-like enzyme (type II secretory pathway)